MRIFIGVFILASLIFYQNCVQSNADVKTVTTPIGPLSAAKEILFSTSENKYSYGILLNSWKSGERTINVDDQTCNLPDSSFEDLQNLWARGEVCQTRFKLIPGSAVCLALVEPYAILKSNENESIPLSGTICAQSYFHLCDPEDQTQLESILKELENNFQSFMCQ